MNDRDTERMWLRIAARDFALRVPAEGLTRTPAAAERMRAAAERAEARAAALGSAWRGSVLSNPPGRPKSIAAAS